MGLRILIVDDSPAMRTFVKRVVNMSGVDISAIFEAADGADALQLLQKEWIDVILTDINMPNMDGEQFVTELARTGTAATTPIIVVSTDGTQNRVERLMALGARGYVVKPFSPELLRDEIERVLGSGVEVGS